MRIPTNINFAEYMENISFLEAQEIHWADHWIDQVEDRIINGKDMTGCALPWSKTHNHIRLRKGELSIWAGVNGHRKSMIVGQIMLWLAKTTRVCIASLEMMPEETLLRMARQAAGCDPSSGWARQFLEWAHERICIYDQLDTIEAERILGMAHYAANELGCAHIVIDSLTKCGLSEEDYAAEKKFVDRLQWAAKHYNVHVHLICHMRKGANEAEIPNKFSIKGTGAITDLADNVFICWKDKIREKAKQKQATGQQLSSEESERLADKDRPDQLLIVEKQRAGEFEGIFKLWFDSKSLQFIPTDELGAMPFTLDNIGSEK